MTMLVYTGQADQRTIRSSDFPEYEGDFEDITWKPGQVHEVPNEVAGFLRVHHRMEFREWVPHVSVGEDEPKPLSEMSVDELRAHAKAFEDEGWEFDEPISKMKKGALLNELESIHAQQLSSGDDDASSESPSVPLPLESQEEMPRRA